MNGGGLHIDEGVSGQHYWQRQLEVAIEFLKLFSCMAITFRK
jgi:hypothetical protein